MHAGHFSFGWHAKTYRFLKLRCEENKTIMQLYGNGMVFFVLKLQTYELTTMLFYRQTKIVDADHEFSNWLYKKKEP